MAESTSPALPGDVEWLPGPGGARVLRIHPATAEPPALALRLSGGGERHLSATPGAATEYAIPADLNWTAAWLQWPDGSRAALPLPHGRHAEVIQLRPRRFAREPDAGATTRDETSATALAGDVSAWGERVADEVSARAERAAGSVSAPGEPLEGDISARADPVADDISARAKRVEGDVSVPGERVAGDISARAEPVAGGVSARVERVAGDVSVPGERVAGDISAPRKSSVPGASAALAAPDGAAPFDISAPEPPADVGDAAPAWTTPPHLSDSTQEAEAVWRERRDDLRRELAEAADAIARARDGERAARDSVLTALAAARADLRASRAAREADASLLTAVNGELEVERAAHAVTRGSVGTLADALATARAELAANKTRAEATALALEAARAELAAARATNAAELADAHRDATQARAEVASLRQALESERARPAPAKADLERFAREQADAAATATRRPPEESARLLANLDAAAAALRASAPPAELEDVAGAASESGLPESAPPAPDATARGAVAHSSSADAGATELGAAEHSSSADAGATDLPAAEHASSADAGATALGAAGQTSDADVGGAGATEPGATERSSDAGATALDATEQSSDAGATTRGAAEHSSDPASSDPEDAAEVAEPASSRPASRSTALVAASADRRLRRALVALAREDSVTAGALLVGLLPAQGAVLETVVTYDLTVRGVGTFAVFVEGSTARVIRQSRRRPRSEALFHLSAEPLVLAELLAGDRDKVGRFRRRAKVSGRRKRMSELAPLRDARLSLAQAVTAGARLEPGLVYQALPHAIDPQWTRGHTFTVAQRIVELAPQTWHISARDGLPLRVVERRTDARADAVVTMSKAAFERMLRDEPPLPSDRPQIRGDRDAVAALKRWTDLARS